MDKVRESTTAEREQMIHALADRWGTDPYETADILANARIVVIEGYMTGGPGYCGRVVIVIYDGAPEFVDQFLEDASGNLVLTGVLESTKRNGEA
jgi:hypothetical protein